MSVEKGKIKTIKSILESDNFYSFLCNYSNNNINEVIDNLQKLINYVLTTEEELESLSIEEILNRAINFKKEGKFLIIATNSYLDNTIKLFGLDQNLRFKGLTKEISLLDHQISYLDFDTSSFFPIYGTIKQAIEEGFTEPKMLYTSILKQPSTDKRPIMLGEPETSYYNSILQRRLKNVPETFAKTGAKIANKVLKEIIGKDITLYFIPTDKELDDLRLNTKISPFQIRSIQIPSRFTLLSTCAKNKGLKEGTKISSTDGSLIEKKKRKEKEYSSLAYFTYEKISITDTFEYSNEELTGDIFYDIDEMYGRFDTKDNRERLDSMSIKTRLERIKNSFDINLVLRNGKYKISNGRHRLLYLKYYYLKNYKDCDERLLKYLKDSVTVIATVDRTIEDEETNKLLIYLEKKYKQVKLLKTNINNDEVNLVILYKNIAYNIKNKNELIELINFFKHNEYSNKYVIGRISNLEFISSEIILSKLILELKERILELDFMDIINYLQNNEIIIGDEIIDNTSLDYENLYRVFTNLLHTEELNRLRNVESKMLIQAQNNIDKYLNKNNRSVKK